MRDLNKIRMIEILLVEDSPDDILLTREAFKESKLVNNLNVVEDGVEALTFLHKKEKYKNAPTCDIVLLDLNLPKKSGREVLKEIKEDNKLKHIPVVILTTSEDEAEVLKAYQLHANCYITKPIHMENFINVISYLENFWVSIVKLPPKVNIKDTESDI